MEKNQEMMLKKEWFIQKKEGKIEDYYIFDQKKRLGEGNFGLVVKAKQKDSENIRAIKIIRKKKIKDPQRLVNEINILKNLDHPNIVRLYEIYQTNEKIYLVMEYCSGGQLFEYTQNKGKLSQDEAKTIFKDIVQGILYCHNKKICHRDLKPQNILLLNNKQGSPIKVIDFGLSAIIDTKQRMKTKAGTVYYISPEVLDGQYDESCDIWSLGVILYFLVSGCPPFYGQSELQIIQMVKRQQYTFQLQQFLGVSDQVKDLISLCLQPQNKRITAAQMLQHPWLDTKNTAQQAKFTQSLVYRFYICSKLKIVILCYLATQLNTNEVEKYSKLFKEYDRNFDGQLEFSQFKQLLQNSGIKNKGEIEFFIKLLDTEKVGKINYNSFLAATIRPEIYSKPQKIKAAWSLFQKNKISYITLEDIKASITGIKINSREWNQILDELETNSEGKLTYENFVKMMSQ